MFQSTILKNNYPEKITFSEVAGQCAEFLHEEANELQEAYDARDVPKIIDSLVDYIYYAIGMAYQMGVDIRPYFLEVHLANMDKVHDPDAVPGVNKRVIKPEGWQEPRIAEIMAYTARRNK
jgi:predicted HAD superfamily Cof-like phosphohydrolase